jgi:hypothetical protein
VLRISSWSIKLVVLLCLSCDASPPYLFLSACFLDLVLSMDFHILLLHFLSMLIVMSSSFFRRQVFLGLWFSTQWLIILIYHLLRTHLLLMWPVCISLIHILLYCHWSTHFLLSSRYYCCGLLCYYIFVIFFRNGVLSPSLCIKRCTQLFLLHDSEYPNYYNHGSAKVETWIKHRNKSSNKRLTILESTSMTPSSSLEIEVMCDRQQPVASSNHRLPLVWEK